MAVRRNLGHEAHANLARLAVGVPLHDILVLNGDLLLYGNEGVEAFVIGGPVDVDPHGFAIAGKGVTIRAGRHVGEDGAAVGAANILEPPANEMDERGG